MKTINFKTSKKNSIYTHFALAKIIKKAKGLDEGELITLAGRSGCGKTTCAVNLMTDLVLDDHKCLYVSCEMSNDELAGKIRHLLTKADDYADCRYFRPKNCSLECENFSIEHIEKCIKKYKPRFVFIDYIQLLDGNVRNNSKALKSIAQKYKCTIIALSQLNRGAVKKEPDLATISRSDTIVHDSNQVWLLHNTTLKNVSDDIILFKVAKNRKGMAFDSFVLFDKAQQRFWNIKDCDESAYFDDYNAFKESNDWKHQLFDKIDEISVKTPINSEYDDDDIKPIIKNGSVSFYTPSGLIIGGKKW